MATAPDFEPRYTLGLDLGQAQDYTALAVLEATTHLNPRDADEAQCIYAVRHLERFPLGTSYTDIAATLVQRCARRPLRGARLVLDHTGVGRAVVDLLKRARPDATLVPVTITAGHHAHRDDQGGWFVPKKDLVGCLQVLLQQHRLSVAAALAEAPTLVKVLENFQVKITAAANDVSAPGGRTSTTTSSWPWPLPPGTPTAISPSTSGPPPTAPPTTLTPAWWKGRTVTTCNGSIGAEGRSLEPRRRPWSFREFGKLLHYGS